MSDFIDNLMNRANELLPWANLAKPEPPTEVNAIAHDTWDDFTWGSILNQARSLDYQRQDLTQDHPTGSEAYEDLFNMLYQGDPQMTNQKSMIPEFQINHDLIRELWDSEQIQDLRKQTMFDEYGSAFALAAMGQQVRETFDRLEEFRQAQQDAMNALQQAMQPGANGQPDPNALQQAIVAVEEANANAQNAAQQAAQDIAAGAAGADQDLKDEAEAMAGYGIGGEQLKQMDYEERHRLAQKLSKGKMKILLSLVGQQKQFARAERRKRGKHAKAEVFDFELSNDLMNLAPGEMTNLAVPELEELFWLRYFKHELLTKKERGPQHLGKGPIIVVCDESGSMGAALDAEGNTREMWSKAVALSLCEQARVEGRDFTYLGFSDSVYEMSWRGGNIPHNDIIEFVEHFMGGGTNLTKPMARARDLILEAHQANRDKPDIIVISDGDTRLSNEFVEQLQATLKRVDAYVYGIQIGGDDRYTESGISPTLELISDKALHITSLNATPEGIQALYEGI
jgi:uncharacterized protein with von Willebrand factor type A (vWA) domain